MKIFKKLNKLMISKFAAVFLIICSVFILLPQVSFAQAVGNCIYPNGTNVSGYTQAQCSADSGTWIQGATDPTRLPSSTGTACTGNGIVVIICKAHQILNSIVP